MNAKELKNHIENGALDAYAGIYADVGEQKKRYIEAIDKFASIFGGERDIYIITLKDIINHCL